ncbi:unnamed protein product, partial [Pylaiella littoralis]
MAAAVANNIAGGRGPAYILCALPYRADAERDREDWGLDTALAIVEEAVEAFDPPRMQARPAKTSWPPELQDKAKALDTFELMRSAYFKKRSKSLPDLREPVPKIEANFYMWLSCRKQQWRKHRNDKKTTRQLTPEEDFPRWLKQRKWDWKSSKMERESFNTPPLEEDFYTWLAERKKVWRLQRLTRKHTGGRGPPSLSSSSGLRDGGCVYPDNNYQHHLQQQQGGGGGDRNG